jgi:hypothetical protein
MKTALLLALLSVAFVGCESSDAISQAAAKAAKASRNESAAVSASAKGRYEFKDGILTFKDALNAELYDENGEDCGIEVEAGLTVKVKALNHDGLIIANKDPQYDDISFSRVSISKINENNLLLGTFEMEFESDNSFEMNRFKFDEEFIEITVQCQSK